MGRPLDKQEAVLYGKFVNAAYAMFKRDQNVLHPEPATGDIPDPYEMVAWIIMSDFTFWGKEIPKFYGLIGRHQQQKRNFILAIRGTEGAIEWLDDATAFLVPFRQVPTAGKVERGFDKIYATLKVVKRHGVAAPLPTVKPTGAAAAALTTAPVREVIQGTFAEQLERLADTFEAPDVMSLAKERRPRRSFVVTGHSLGSALATLFVMENKQKNKFDITTICTFASPHVGNTEFVDQFDKLALTSWRIVNTQDLVPKVPLRLPFFDYQHVATPYEFSSAGVVKWGPACWHSMSTYLHWLDASIDIDPECKP
ncbi:MAG TPA: lipase family protein [Candidatus Acidoferrum sp.]|nr:lipase family protein [Candidatus Acidoferrum sp.]